MKKLLITLLTGLTLTASALDIVSVNTNNFTLNRTNFSGSVVSFSDVYIKGTNVQTMLDGKIDTNKTITVNGETKNLNDNPTFTVEGGIDEATATNISEYVISPYTNRITTAWQNPPGATNWLWSSDGSRITLTNYNFTTGGTAVVIPDTLDNLPVAYVASTVFNIGTPDYTGTAITSVSGGNNLVQFLNDQFRNCLSLSTVSCPVTPIAGSRAFMGCTNLTSILMPKLTNTGSSTFESCTNLTTISLPSIIALGNTNFKNCMNLNSVYFSGNAPTVGTTIYTGITANQVTNYVTNPNATGWGLTLGDMPVYRTAMAVNSDTTVFDLSTIATGSTVNTVKVTRAMGMHLGILLTKNTVFEMDMTTFPTNSQSRITMCINPATYTATWSTGFSAPISLTANKWHTSYWLRGCYWPSFVGKVEVSP